MRLMLLKAASAPSELLEAYTLNTVAVVTDVKSKLCPFLGTGWWPQHVTGREKAKTFPLLSQDRDALLKAEKFYSPFQQDRTTFKACFHLKSSCAKTLASLTDTSLSLWGLQMRYFSCSKRCLGFERKAIYFILMCDQCDIILQVKRSLCWHRRTLCRHTCCPVLPSTAPHRLTAFKSQHSVILPNPTSQLSYSKYFLTIIYFTAI